MRRSDWEQLVRYRQPASSRRRGGWTVAVLAVALLAVVVTSDTRPGGLPSRPTLPDLASPPLQGDRPDDRAAPVPFGPNAPTSTSPGSAAPPASASPSPVVVEPPSALDAAGGAGTLAPSLAPAVLAPVVSPTPTPAPPTTEPAPAAPPPIVPDEPAVPPTSAPPASPQGAPAAADPLPEPPQDPEVEPAPQGKKLRSASVEPDTSKRPEGPPGRAKGGGLQDGGKPQKDLPPDHARGRGPTTFV